jgi:hypothetical protein
MTNNNPTGFNRVTEWLQQRQARVLNNAFTAAQEIKVLEDQYYDGSPIVYSAEQSKTVYDYLRSLRDRKLLQIRTNLTQFRLNSFVLNQSASETAAAETIQEQAVLDQLNFIESVIGKYRESPEDDLAQAAAMMAEDDGKQLKGALRSPATDTDAQPSSTQIMDPVIMEVEADKQQRNRIGLFGGGLIGGDLDPNYELRVVQELRLKRKQNQVAMRWLVILIFVPLLLGLLSRYLVFDPLLGSYADKYPDRIELDAEIQAEFDLELNNYKERLEVQELLGVIPEMTPEEERERLSDKAVELWQEAREAELRGLKNLLADLTALAIFVGLVYFNRSRLSILRNATNRTFLSLSDTTKVFIFILVTDMFVGFHSAEGWSVILNSLGYHFGLSENEAAVGMFIATVPVFLDACIKFWIFSYLTRFSPASSAVYERMNT